MTHQAAVLQVTRIGVTVRDAPILADIDLEVRQGEIVGIAGESGSGKSTLAGCISGDVPPSAGVIHYAGGRLSRRASARRRPRVGVVWQTTAQCGNLDVASNLMLGAETPWMARSSHRLHVAARQIVADLGLELPDVARPMASLTHSEQQLVAIARAMRDAPELLVLDDPTFALGARETAIVEQLLIRSKDRGAALILASSDLHQLLRLCDRITVLRHGRIVTEVDPEVTHVDDLAALAAGQQVATSARRQLLRIQSLADQLATSSGLQSGLPLILTALGAALGTDTLCLHVRRGAVVELASSAGLTPEQQKALHRLTIGEGPIGAVARSGGAVTEPYGAWLRNLGLTGDCFAVPIAGSAGVLGAITVFTTQHQPPTPDMLDLAGLYAGYAAAAIEHERLLDEITARNRVLETIRSALEVLSGPGGFDAALLQALGILRDGVGAASVVLCEPRPDGSRMHWATEADAGVSTPADAPRPHLDGAHADGAPRVPDAVLVAVRQAEALVGESEWPASQSFDASPVATPTGSGVLLAQWPDGRPVPADGTPDDTHALLADAAHFLSLAFERQVADGARQEAAALRRAEQLQREFLARLSHELRTPLTAIRGYASSLTQPDVQWSEESQHAFLTRISDESDRLGRLVGDLLDFSAMESGVLRLNRDWCDLPLILDAARACLPAAAAARVTIHAAPDLPAVWADHDRLEQVFVNLLGNAIHHNPPTTTVAVAVSPGSDGVTITVTDDGVGLPERDDGVDAFRSRTSGSGLGLSIVRGIIAAHGGTVAPEPVARGTRWRIVLQEDPAAPDSESQL
jgi:signal transduction histidine kinase/ABC-type multidrug transport system ATPase subunit